MIDSETLHSIAAGRLAPPGLVSIVLPHYDTPKLARLCLREMIAPFEADAALAVLGADKIDAPGPLWVLVKELGGAKTYRRWAYRLAGRTVPEALAPRPRHARSFCALYRRRVLVEEHLDFTPGRFRTAGEDVYHELVSRGYGARLLRPRGMRRLVVHLVHATACLSPHRGLDRGRVRRRTGRRIRRLLDQPWVKALLEDDSLDAR